MSQNRSQLLQIYKTDFLEALNTLSHSWAKLQNESLPDVTTKNLDELESWEALTSRFARCTDIFLSKYIRLLVLDLDPGFRGEMRDYLDKAEKASLISDADQWMKIRELRNKIAHEYTKEDLQNTLKEVLRFTSFVLTELKRFQN
jgi:uncharacterized protein with HEPN domain